MPVKTHSLWSHTFECTRVDINFYFCGGDHFYFLHRNLTMIKIMRKQPIFACSVILAILGIGNFSTAAAAAELPSLPATNSPSSPSSTSSFLWEPLLAVNSEHFNQAFLPSYLNFSRDILSSSWISAPCSVRLRGALAALSLRQNWAAKL